MLEQISKHEKKNLPQLPRLATLLLAAIDLVQPEFQEEGQDYQVVRRRVEGGSRGWVRRISGGERENERTFKSKSVTFTFLICTSFCRLVAFVAKF